MNSGISPVGGVSSSMPTQNVAHGSPRRCAASAPASAYWSATTTSGSYRSTAASAAPRMNRLAGSTCPSQRLRTEAAPDAPSGR